MQGTENARILIDNNLFLAVVQKARERDVESYSAFRDERGRETEMGTVLGVNGIRNLLVYGIATDYCVRATSVDAFLAGYSVTVVEELCRGVAPVTTASALAGMKEQGIRIIPALADAMKEIEAYQSSLRK